MKYSPNDLPGPAAPIIPRLNTDLMNVLLHSNLLHWKRHQLGEELSLLCVLITDSCTEINNNTHYVEKKVNTKLVKHVVSKSS